MTLVSGRKPLTSRIIRTNNRVFRRTLFRSLFKPTLAAQSRKIVGPRSGNDNPCRSDLPLLDGLVTLQHERALASTESSVKSLHADENCRLIVASHLQRPHRRFAIDISRERFVQMDLHEYRPRGLIVGRRIRTLHRNLRLSMFARRRRTPRDYQTVQRNTTYRRNIVALMFTTTSKIQPAKGRPCI